ncbi:MAG: hypothetical protein RIF41_32155 [Polyangiaceae bacterium]
MGLDLFRVFLNANAIAPAEAARQLKTTRVSLYQWLSGVRPSYPMRLRIERWTRGQVPAKAWLTPQEIASVEQVVPWEAA